MGVNKLHQFLRKNFPDSISTITNKELKNRVLFVDVSIFIYKYFSSMTYQQKTNLQIKYLEDREGNKISHLVGFLSLTRTLLSRKCRPVYVFDGESEDIKAEEVIQKEFKKKKIKRALQRVIRNCKKTIKF